MIGRIRPIHGRRDDGASAVELALVLPILMLILFGIISFGLYFAGSLGMSNATREAARYGVVQNRTCQQIADSLASTSSGTLGVVYPINFTITRGAVSCGGSIASSSASASVTSGAASTVMCAGSTSTTDELKIQATAGANLFIPSMVINLKLVGRGAYRCEFS
jgi:Flp pilus assembly protein TadG